MTSTWAGRRIGDGVLVLSAGVLACATVMIPSDPTSSVRTLVLVGLIVALVLIAVIWGSAPAVRAAVVVATVSSPSPAEPG